MSYITSDASGAFHSGGNTGASASVTITHAAVGWALTDSTEGNRKVLFNGALTASVSLNAGDPIALPAGALDLNFPNGAVPDQTMKDMLDAYISGRSGDPTVILGTGAIGLGSSPRNEVADANYQRKTVSIVTGLGTAPTS